jgi:hypothetical protein
LNTTGDDIGQLRRSAETYQLTGMRPFARIGEGLRENVGRHPIACFIQHVHVIVRQDFGQPRDGHTMSASNVTQRRILPGANDLQCGLIVLMDDTSGLRKEVLPHRKNGHGMEAKCTIQCNDFGLRRAVTHALLSLGVEDHGQQG